MFQLIVIWHGSIADTVESNAMNLKMTGICGCIQFALSNESTEYERSYHFNAPNCAQTAHGTGILLDII